MEKHFETINMYCLFSSQKIILICLCLFCCAFRAAPTNNDPEYVDAPEDQIDRRPEAVQRVAFENQQHTSPRANEMNNHDALPRIMTNRRQYVESLPTQHVHTTPVVIQTPRSDTFSHRSRQGSIFTRPGIVSHHERQDRFPGQFLQPRFKNGLYRDVAMAAADFQGTLSFLLIAFFASGLDAGVNEISVAYAMGLLGSIFCHGSGQANPSISIIQAFLGKLSARQALMNIVAQTLASITASGLQTWAVGRTQSIATLSDSINAPQGLLVETIMSTILFTTVLWASALPSLQQRFAPFLIALVFYGLEICSIPFTSGSLNVARWLGPAIVSNTWPTHSWIWAAGPSIAVPLSILLFKGNELLQTPEGQPSDIGPGQLIQDVSNTQQHHQALRDHQENNDENDHRHNRFRRKFWQRDDRHSSSLAEDV